MAATAPHVDDSAARTPAPLVQAVGLSKRYGRNVVLSSVDVELGGGEVVALIGENGAGKSTLAKVIAGAVRPDGGSLRFAGEPVTLSSPRDALRKRVAFIPQELAYVPDLTVAENILLARWPSLRGLTNQRLIRVAAQREVDQLDLTVDVRRRMGSLKLADRQIVEIIKALVRHARVIVLDEPTASLTRNESGALFSILRRLAQAGTGLLYVSHQMQEVYDFSDRVDVMRNGEIVASAAPAATTPDDLIGHMLGRRGETLPLSGKRQESEQVLELIGWRREGQPQLRNISLSLRRGEILGIFGVRGSGAELVAEGLAGRRRDIAGEIRVEGHRQQIFSRPLDARRARIAYVPAERKREGLILPLSVQQNTSLLVLRTLARAGVLRPSAERRLGVRLMSEFDVRARGPGQVVGELSGGNQQKVLLASRLASHPQVLVLQEPTRGVDVGARFQIHKLLRQVADDGMAVLIVTADVEEAVAATDRLLVMHEGELVQELTDVDKTTTQALRSATGGRIEHERRP